MRSFGNETASDNKWFAMRTVGTVFLLVSLYLLVGQPGVLVSLEVVHYLIDRLRERVLHAAGDGGRALRSSPRRSVQGGPAGQTRSSGALTDVVGQRRLGATHYDCDALGCAS